MRFPIVVALLFAATPLAAQTIDPATQARIDRILKATPLIDGHNDLPWASREDHDYSTEGLASGTDTRKPPLMTDIARLRQGRVGAQFWSVYIPAKITGGDAIKATAEQIDFVQRLVRRYPKDLELATTADDIVRIHKAGRIASLMGMEGGHQIANSMAALREFHRAGVRYMTLTHNDNNDWADSATDDPKHGGLTNFGRAVVGEMNRLGMIVDLSHVAPTTMNAALAATRAPVIFSHSDVRALTDHPRNVPDDVLALLPANGGVVMVNAFPGHLDRATIDRNAMRQAEDKRLSVVFPGQPDRRKAALDAWDTANPRVRVPMAVMADHIEHVRKVAGIDHVGIGADLDGVPTTVVGFEGVDGYPRLFAELIRRGWTDAELAKLAGGNVLRVMRGVEATALAMKNVPPSMATISTK